MPLLTYKHGRDTLRGDYSDLFCVRPDGSGGFGKALGIEVKSAGLRPTPRQLIMHAISRSLGIETRIEHP
jgi:hypothetical protein